jgi:hypothetical protein
MELRLNKIIYSGNFVSWVKLNVVFHSICDICLINVVLYFFCNILHSVNGSCLVNMVLLLGQKICSFKDPFSLSLKGNQQLSMTDALSINII